MSGRENMSLMDLLFYFCDSVNFIIKAMGATAIKENNYGANIRHWREW